MNKANEGEQIDKAIDKAMAKYAPEYSIVALAMVLVDMSVLEVPIDVDLLKVEKEIKKRIRVFLREAPDMASYIKKKTKR